MIRSVLAVAVVVLLLGCLRGQEDAAMIEDTRRSAEAGGESWRPLFDGRTTEGWRGYRSQTIPAGWRVTDGALTREAAGGDIITTDTFGDFELELEWMVEPGGNSGIFYRATERTDVIYENAIEMQVLDDAGHADGQSPLTSAGALYGLYPAPRGVVRPAGQWNTARVVARGDSVEHWLNGTRIVQTRVGGDDWNARVRGSKFTEWPQFAQAREGHIGLQDHGDRVAFRNIRIRVLP